MFDIGWSEMMVIGVVALVVLGPKELPGALRTFAYWTKQARKMAREFQSGVDDMIRQSELDEARKAMEQATRTLNRDIENSIDPTGDLKKAVTETEKAVRAPLSPTPSTAAKAADPTAPDATPRPEKSPEAAAPGAPEITPQAPSPAPIDRVVNG